MEIGAATLILFFTKRMSLKTWADIGIIDRELAIYKKLAMYLREVNMVTYGGSKDKAYSDKFGDIKILPTTWHNKAITIIQLLMKHYSKIKNFNHF